MALEVVEVAVEAGGAAVGAVVAQREHVERVSGGCVVSKRLARRRGSRERQRDQERGGGPRCASHGVAGAGAGAGAGTGAGAAAAAVLWSSSQVSCYLGDVGGPGGSSTWPVQLELEGMCVCERVRVR